MEMNSRTEDAYFAQGIGKTHPVGQYAPNGYGIYDMAGNAWEACWDRYEKDHYTVTKEPLLDPVGPRKGDVRVVRGGSGAAKATQSTVHYRKDFNKTWTNYLIGLRTVISQPPWEAPMAEESDALTSLTEKSFSVAVWIRMPSKINRSETILLNPVQRQGLWFLETIRRELHWDMWWPRLPPRMVERPLWRAPPRCWMVAGTKSFLQ